MALDLGPDSSMAPPSDPGGPRSNFAIETPVQSYIALFGKTAMSHGSRFHGPAVAPCHKLVMGLGSGAGMDLRDHIIVRDPVGPSDQNE